MKLKNKLLIKINENPGLTFAEICDSFQLTKGNISIHLRNLEKEKMIIKYFSLSNKKVKIHPTKKGKDIYLREKLKNIEYLIST